MFSLQHQPIAGTDRRIRALFVVIVFAVVAGCVPASDELTASSINEDDSHCPGECPDGLVPVDRCPTFPTDCQEVSDCDDTLICADPDDVDPGNGTTGPGELDCDDPVECPAGTEEVSSCPQGDLCSHIQLCDEELICREAPEICKNEPLCPDDERAVEDCTHDACYHKFHCSGPVECLPCTDELADGCSGDDIAVDRQWCDDIVTSSNDDDPQNDGEGSDSEPGGDEEDSEDDDSDSRDDGSSSNQQEDESSDHNGDDAPPRDDTVVCRRTETCEETLYCASSPGCIEEPACAQGTQPVDDCADAERDCYTISACQGSKACEADPYQSPCEDAPQCPEYHQEIELEDCITNDDCEIEASCGEIAACVPEDE